MIDEALEIIEDYLNGESDTDDIKTDIAVLVDMDLSLIHIFFLSLTFTAPTSIISFSSGFSPVVSISITV